MPAKTCQLDIIPTDRLKQVLQGCLLALTHITNRSLDGKLILQRMQRSIGQTTDNRNHQLA